MARTTAGRERSGPIAAIRSRRGESHAGQTDSVCYEVSRSLSQCWHPGAISRPIRHRVLVHFAVFLLSGIITSSVLMDPDTDSLDTDTYTYTFPKGVVLKDETVCDYIVVGAGAAGSAVASRLALDGFDVILLEAGDDPNEISKIPSAAMSLLGSSLDWQYKTIPNNVSCLSSQGKQCRFSRGKCLGGSTSINYMLYTRGNRRDYDNINVPGWTWRDLKPYFLRYEGLRVLDELPPSSVPYHNTTGTMKIEFFDDPKNPWHERIVQGLKSLNFPENPDVNAKSQIGVTKSVGYVYKGERMSTARGFLSRPDVKRKLRVAKRAYCTGVLIDDDNVARGVTVVQGPLRNLQLKLRARREVILSAGTIGTPQILMLSGIGPADHLKEMGIPVRSNLPVGSNMSDHVLPLLFALVDKGSGVAPELLTLAQQASKLAEFIVSREGPFASDGLTDIVGFANIDCYDATRRQLNNDREACELPTLQLINAYVGKNLVSLAKPLFKQGIGFNDDIVDQLAKVNKEYAFLILSPIVLQPFSRGYVRLASADPLERPAVFANYLGDSRDVDHMVRSIRLIEHMLETEPLAAYNATLLRLRLSKCGRGGMTKRSSYWQCYARHMTYAVYHAAGTCALGRVLDPRLRVLGVRRLRVADLSALPYVPRGNTEAVALAIGERAVDFIRQDLTNQGQ